MPALTRLDHSLRTAHDVDSLSAFQLVSNILQNAEADENRTNGPALWDYLENNPDRQSVFTQAMRALDTVGKWHHPNLVVPCNEIQVICLAY